MNVNFNLANTLRGFKNKLNDVKVINNPTFEYKTQANVDYNKVEESDGSDLIFMKNTENRQGSSRRKTWRGIAAP